jgi:hypothetical protein
MVVAPTELFNIYGCDEDTLKRIEHRIDALLKKNYKGNGPALIPFNNDCYCVDVHKLDRYLDRYRDAGWSQVRIRHRGNRSRMEFYYSYSRIFGPFAGGHDGYYDGGRRNERKVG